MKKHLAALAFVFLYAACGALQAAPAAKAQPTDLAKEVDRLFPGCGAPGSPGGAVVLVDKGKTVLMRCRGLASIEHGVPITAATRFELASVSKHFTSLAVLLLEQAGKLGLSDRIQDHLPELPDYGAPVTVADLLHHTSGLSDWLDTRPYAGKGVYDGFEIKDLVALIARQRKLEFAPGSKWSYSNSNYALLAEIVSRVTDKPFGEWMRENVFAPLKMGHTLIPAAGKDLIPQRANSYRRLPSGAYERSLVEGFAIPGPAHVFTSLEDMAKWLDNLRTGKIGGPGILERMMQRPALAGGETSFYGAGLGVGEYRGVRTVGHSGQCGGFMSEMVCLPDLGIGVLAVGNVRTLPVTDIAYRTLDLYLGDKLRPPAKPPAPAAAPADKAAPVNLDPAEYKRFSGGYRLDADPSVLVAVATEGEWLVGGLSGEGMDLFRPVGPAEFESRSRNCRLAFFEADLTAGTPGRVRITLRGNEMWATRVSLAEDARWIDECAGFYYSDELEVAYRIVRNEAGELAVFIPDAEDRPLAAADRDTFFGGLGFLNFRRDGSGRVVAFDLCDPENLGGHTIHFDKRGECR